MHATVGVQIVVVGGHFRRGYTLQDAFFHLEHVNLAHLVTGSETSTPVAYLGIGVLVSFAVGLASLWWLVRWLERGRFQWFAYWCIPVGLAVVLLKLLGSGG